MWLQLLKQFVLLGIGDSWFICQKSNNVYATHAVAQQREGPPKFILSAHCLYKRLDVPLLFEEVVSPRLTVHTTITEDDAPDSSFFKLPHDPPVSKRILLSSRTYLLIACAGDIARYSHSRGRI